MTLTIIIITIARIGVLICVCQSLFRNADKIVDIRLVNSYLLDLVDKDEALTEQEIEECQQEALKYKQGVLAAGSVVQTIIEDLGASVATSSAPEMPLPLQILTESVAPEMRPTKL